MPAVRVGRPARVPPGYLGVRQDQEPAVGHAWLLLRGGRVATLDELAEALWGEQPPPSARESLQNYVARLRKALGAGGDAVIVTEPGGYRIALGPGELDVDRFEAALVAGRAAARAGDWPRAAEALREGLALWRGEPLAGVESKVLAAQDRARLAELRWQVAEGLAEADLRLGRHAEVIGELRRLAGEAPLRERVHVLLMTALWRDGQQAAALAAYQDARAVLAAELGADPGPELQGLHRQILQGAPALAGAAGSAHALAGRYPDRQLFIDLHGHTPGRDPVTPQDALAGLLAATGTDPRFLPDSLEGRAAMWRDKMAGQRALLVLDNAASSSQVTPLLPGSGGCLVLVTSRRHLGDLPGAVTPVLIDVLPPQQAQEMFTRLAPRAAASPGEVAEVTALAGCLPLAVALLARVLARHPSWAWRTWPPRPGPAC